MLSLSIIYVNYIYSVHDLLALGLHPFGLQQYAGKSHLPYPGLIPILKLKSETLTLITNPNPNPTPNPKPQS